MSTTELVRKAQLLSHYASKSICEYEQLDGFACSDEVCATTTDELRSGSIAVRVQILRGTAKEDVLQLLKTMRKLYKQGIDFGVEGPIEPTECPPAISLLAFAQLLGDVSEMGRLLQESLPEDKAAEMGFALSLLSMVQAKMNADAGPIPESAIPF